MPAWVTATCSHNSTPVIGVPQTLLRHSKRVPAVANSSPPPPTHTNTHTHSRTYGNHAVTDSRSDLADQGLKGVLPQTLSLPKTLVSLNLGGNSLSGPLPTKFVMPPGLRHLQLCCNKFTGKLPGGWVASPVLETFSLDHNNFTGSVPAAWRLPKSLRVLNLHGNALSGRLPEWRQRPALNVAVRPGNAGLCGKVSGCNPVVSV